VVSGNSLVHALYNRNNEAKLSIPVNQIQQKQDLILNINPKRKNHVSERNLRKIQAFSPSKRIITAGNAELIMFAPAIGRVAERLGRGLQNLVQQFESARDLKGKQSLLSEA